MSIWNSQKLHKQHFGGTGFALSIKKMQKNKEVSEDDQKRAEKEVQNDTDKQNAEIDQYLEHKEKELMTL